MKKYFLFSNLFLLLFFACPHTAFAKKKYRYIKREHGVRFNWNNPLKLSGGFAGQTDIKGAYTYNWMGMVEFGPYVSFNADITPFKVNMFSGGILVEYNIIKNRGKRKLIPAIGIKLGAQQGSSIIGSSAGSVSEWNMTGGAHGALKAFVSKRSTFVISIGYQASTPFASAFQQGSLYHNIDISMGFAHYFDFY